MGPGVFQKMSFRGDTWIFSGTIYTVIVSRVSPVRVTNINFLLTISVQNQKGKILLSIYQFFEEMYRDLGPVVRRPISVNPGLNLTRVSFVLLMFVQKHFRG